MKTLILSSKIYFLILAFAFSINSCKNQTESENENSEAIENPWIYINRISDTLVETEFSLFNSPETNQTILKKFDANFKMLKYRIGQGNHLPVYTKSIRSSGGEIICYLEPEFQIDINFNNEILINGEPCELDKIDSLFLKHIESSFNLEYFDQPNALFSIYSDKEIDQEFIQKVISHLANGYWLFLNPLDKKGNKISFSKLNSNKQNEILRKVPFGLNYDFYKILYSRPAIQRILNKNQ